MTSPILIKVARAIEVAPDKWNASPDLQSRYPLQEYIAREAVMALREPSEGMVAAGDCCLCSSMECGCYAPRIWQAMIDEALRP